MTDDEKCKSQRLPRCQETTTSGRTNDSAAVFAAVQLQLSALSVASTHCMAQPPLTVSPETVELRVGGALQLRLANVRADGEISWFFEGAPLPGQTGPVCRCARGHCISSCGRVLARSRASSMPVRGLGDAPLASIPSARGAATGRPLVRMHGLRREGLTFLAGTALPQWPLTTKARTALWCSAGRSAGWKATFLRASRSRRCVRERLLRCLRYSSTPLAALFAPCSAACSLADALLAACLLARCSLPARLRLCGVQAAGAA